MKFDLNNWFEVKKDGQISRKKGRVQILLSCPCAVYAQAHGVEVLVGFGSSFDLQISEEMIFRAELPKGARMFTDAIEPTVRHPEGEVYTNIDRMPDESGSVAEVLRARRMFDLEQRQMLRLIREERQALEEAQAKREARKRLSPEPEPDNEAKADDGEAQA